MAHLHRSVGLFALTLTLTITGGLDLAQAKVSESLVRTDLQNIARKNHHEIGYNNARKVIMGDIYLEGGGSQFYVTDVYCQQEYKSPGPGKVPSHTVINVEHTWPQSHFSGPEKGKQKSDLHHLFPSDSQLNSIRGNHPFGEVDVTLQNLDCECSRFGLNRSGDTVFEPPVEHRGNVARALFYFSVRYGMDIDSEQESVLRKWHEQDPVDDAERIRHDEIKEIQGNVNPFIENPHWVDTVSDF